jgi:DNA-directed RNA polymerase I subunit RPA49
VSLFVRNYSTLREGAEESQESTNKGRLIPPFSADATDPADVYPLHNIIPEAEWKAIPTSAFESAQSHQERVQLLPFRRSDWIHYHLRNLAQKENKNNKNLYVVHRIGFASRPDCHLNSKILFYISAMFALRQALLSKNFDKEKLFERMSSVPGIIVDNMLSRFAETPRNSSR